MLTFAVARVVSRPRQTVCVMFALERLEGGRESPPPRHASHRVTGSRARGDSLSSVSRSLWMLIHLIECWIQHSLMLVRAAAMALLWMVRKAAK